MRKMPYVLFMCHFDLTVLSENESFKPSQMVQKSAMFNQTVLEDFVFR